jgi:hypothetical protein
MDALLNLILISPISLVIVPVGFGLLMFATHLWFNRGRY